MGQECKRWQGTLHQCFEAIQVEIRVNLKLLEATTVFQYLGQNVMYNNRDWATLYINLRKYQMRWGMISTILGKTGEPIK